MPLLSFATQLLDLQELCTACDVRDDHLSEERAQRFTQEALREALLTPIRGVWHDHSRSWFCMTRIDEGALSLYQAVPQGSKRRRQERALIQERAD